MAGDCGACGFDMYLAQSNLAGDWSTVARDDPYREALLPVGLGVPNRVIQVSPSWGNLDGKGAKPSHRGRRAVHSSANLTAFPCSMRSASLRTRCRLSIAAVRRFTLRLKMSRREIFSVPLRGAWSESASGSTYGASGNSGVVVVVDRMSRNLASTFLGFTPSSGSCTTGGDALRGSISLKREAFRSDAFAPGGVMLSSLSGDTMLLLFRTLRDAFAPSGETASRIGDTFGPAGESGDVMLARGVMLPRGVWN